MDPPAPRPISRSTLFLGLIGTSVLVVGGALAGAVAPEASGRFWSVPTVPVRPRIDLVPALAMFYGGLILLVRAWLRLRRECLRRDASVAAVVLVAVVWSLPLLVGPPLGSRDVYAYAAQGRMAAEGLDVYEQGPSALGDDPVLDSVDPLYLDAPVVYGPVFVALSSALSERTGGGVVASVLAFRALAVAGLAVAAVAVWDLARGLGRNEADAMVLTIANPLVLLHLVSGAHNEAIMLAFLMSGVAIGRRARWRHVGVALCAFAASIKVPAVLGAVFLVWPWMMAAPTLRSRAVRLLVGAAETLIVITLATRFTGWGWGWVDAIMDATPVDAYLSITQVVGEGVTLTTGLDAGAVLAVARLSGLLVAGLATLMLLVRGRQSAPVALGWSLLLFALFHPTTQPWYLTWGILLLAAATAGDRNRGFVGGCAFAAFVVLPVGPQLGLVLVENAGVVPVAVALGAMALLTLSPLPDSPPRRRLLLSPDVVSVIVPTRDESANVEPLVEDLLRGTSPLRDDGLSVEILFVDDSADRTPDVVTVMAERVCHEEGFDVRLLHRDEADRWGGLAGAVVDGFDHVRGSTVVVMDGDLQHPAAVIPNLVGAVLDRSADLVVASRRIPGGSDSAGLTRLRLAASKVMGFGVRRLFPRRVGPVADPLSGFFAVRLDALDLERLHPDGFKILVELLASQRELRVVERPFRFGDRGDGVSKASWAQLLRFIGHTIDLRVRTSRPWAGAGSSARRVLGSASVTR